jgi:hypothetical protein
MIFSIKDSAIGVCSLFFRELCTIWNSRHWSHGDLNVDFFALDYYVILAR